MIPVRKQPEYPAFDADVRQPGKRFLRNQPSPSSRDFRHHDYWRRARAELLTAYVRCAYTSLRMRGTGVSVDHFLPKAKYPQLAYEWDNYRLARPSLNHSKADSEAVLDPFGVRRRWFVLDLPSCLIHPGDDLSGTTREDVKATISVLSLNCDALAEERSRWLVDLAKMRFPFDYLRGEYPFLASEVERQGIRGSIGTLFALN